MIFKERIYQKNKTFKISSQKKTPIFNYFISILLRTTINLLKLYCIIV